MANICPCTFGNSVSHALNNLRNARKLKEELPEQTSPATVLSRRVDTCYSLEKSDSSWAYLVKFRLENGDETELNVKDKNREFTETEILIAFQHRIRYERMKRKI